MYLLQITSVLFALSAAWALHVGERKMIDNGASRKEEKDYHLGSFLIRALYCVGISIALPHDWLLYVLSIALNGFIVWFVFDIFLNVFLDRGWDYLGTTAKTDRWWVDHFEGDAGKMKAGLCFIMVVLLNLLFILL